MASEVNSLILLENYVELTDSYPELTLDMSNTEVGGQTSKQFFQEVDALLEQGHDTQKDLFFRLLKPEFLATLNPVY